MADTPSSSNAAWRDDVLLELRGVGKTYPGVRALDGVDLDVRAGEVHALMGENGAGKSTLIRVLTGAERRDGGSIRLRGRPADPRTPLEAQRLGISTVYQEISLVPQLSVAENLCLGRQPAGRLGRIDWRRQRLRAAEALHRLEIEIDPDAALGGISIALQQMVAIARALSIAARVLILDEPTSSLDEREADRLFAVLRRLRGEGLAIIFVTHFIDQVYTIADRITVLRNGRRVGTWTAAALPRRELVSAMLGRPAAPPEHAAPTAPTTADAAAIPLVEVRGLRRGHAVGPLRFGIVRGAVLGLAGLLGSGRTETARLLFGLDRADAGELRVRGKARRVSSPRRAIALGFGYLPEDRQRDGLMPDLPLRENIAIALQARRGWWRPLGRRRQQRIADGFVAALRIAAPDTERPIRLLSGGNQQKALLARWLALEPDLLILDEPTRGVDIGAKAEIEKLVASLRRRGMALLLVSSELEELVRDSDRVVVLRDGRQVERIEGAELTVQRVMDAIAAAPQEDVT